MQQAVAGPSTSGTELRDWKGDWRDEEGVQARAESSSHTAGFSDWHKASPQTPARGAVSESASSEVEERSSGTPSISGRVLSNGLHSSSFITHEVGPRDTLIGLAVRYHVSVSDIMRANGLLSDTAMFAKGELLIPLKALRIAGPEHTTLAGMIVTQYGRPLGGLQAGNFEEQGAGLSSHVSSALDQLRGFYGLGTPASPAASNASQSTGRENEQGALLRGRSRLRDLRDARERSGSGEVEMTEFERPQRAPLPRPSSTSQLQLGHAGARGGPAHDERLRRRTTAETATLGQAAAADDVTVDQASPATDGAPPRSPLLPGSGPSSAAARSSASGRLLQRGPSSAGRLAASAASSSRQLAASLVEKIRRAASQPALAQPQRPGALEAADAAVNSFADIGSNSSLTTLQRTAMAVAPPRSKESKAE